MDSVEALKGEATIFSTWYRGIAKVHLSALNFGYLEKAFKNYCEDDVTYFKKIYNIQGGCDRLNEENYISAVVNDKELLYSLQASGHDYNSIRTPSINSVPYLSNIKLECLHGSCKIKAATSVLQEDDLWWVVKIFSNNLPYEAKIKVFEKYSNQIPFSDGEIFRNIRLYYHTGNTDTENTWWTRLTPAKRRDLQQLLRKEKFAAAFDSLLDKPGLWSRLQLGTLHRFLTLRCEEELLNYLKHINNIWNFILGESISSSAVDTTTVDSLEALAPAISNNDKNHIVSLVHSGKIFNSVQDVFTRHKLLDNILTVCVLIPSIRLFFENLKYIEPCCKILRQILDPKQKRTIRQELIKSWNQPVETITEYSEGNFGAYSSANIDAFGVAYASLWLFTLRHFPNMTSFLPRKDRNKKKPVANTPDVALWHKMGKLATELGFRTDEIERLTEIQPDKAITEEFLKRHTSQIASAKQIQVVMNVIQELSTHDTPNRKIEFTAGSKLPREFRYGRPYTSSHEADQDFLFLPSLNDETADRGLDITTLYAKLDMINAFLNISLAIRQTMSRNSLDQISTQQAPTPQFISSSSDIVDLYRAQSSSSIYSEQSRQTYIPSSTAEDGENAQYKTTDTYLKEEIHVSNQEQMEAFFSYVHRRVYDSNVNIQLIIVEWIKFSLCRFRIFEYPKSKVLEVVVLLIRRGQNVQRNYGRLQLLTPNGRVIPGTEPKIIKEIWLQYDYLVAGLDRDLQPIKSLTNLRSMQVLSRDPQNTLE